MQKKLSKTQNTEENKELIKVIKSGLIDFNKKLKICLKMKKKKQEI